MTDYKPTASTESQAQVSHRIFTIPNILCFIRLAGSMALIPVVWQKHSEIFLWVFIFLTMTDWVDGKLAVLLNQRSVLGARLDSWADAALYTVLAFALIWIYGDTLQRELPWILVALSSYVVSTLAGLARYRRWPSYHTRAAKTSWFLTLLAVVFLFMDWSLWPLHIAIAAITLTNLEAMAITVISPVWRADVRSVYDVWQSRPGGAVGQTDLAQSHDQHQSQ